MSTQIAKVKGCTSIGSGVSISQSIVLLGWISLRTLRFGSKYYIWGQSMSGPSSTRLSQTWLKVGLQTGLVPRPQVGTCMDLESDSISYQIQKQIRDLDPIFIDTRNQVSNSNYFQVGDAGLSDNRISICNRNVSLSLAKFNRYHSYQHHH